MDGFKWMYWPFACFCWNTAFKTLYLTVSLLLRKSKASPWLLLLELIRPSLCQVGHQLSCSQFQSALLRKQPRLREITELIRRGKGNTSWISCFRLHFLPAHAKYAKHRRLSFTMTAEIWDVIVVGAGLSGLSAAHLLKKRNAELRVLILEGKG